MAPYLKLLSFQKKKKKKTASGKGTHHVGILRVRNEEIGRLTRVEDVIERIAKAKRQAGLWPEEKKKNRQASYCNGSQDHRGQTNRSG